ncbi:hypothetical protein OF83DRAFT_1085695 [Amylostereum chailletii]|nr:hypothetical protein OF83DRAFT_1085695 [Amylostereum chailletii]
MSFSPSGIVVACPSTRNGRQKKRMPTASVNLICLTKNPRIEAPCGGTNDTIRSRDSDERSVFCEDFFLVEEFTFYMPVHRLITGGDPSSNDGNTAKSTSNSPERHISNMRRPPIEDAVDDHVDSEEMVGGLGYAKGHMSFSPSGIVVACPSTRNGRQKKRMPTASVNLICLTKNPRIEAPCGGTNDTIRSRDSDERSVFCEDFFLVEEFTFYMPVHRLITGGDPSSNDGNTAKSTSNSPERHISNMRRPPIEDAVDDHVDSEIPKPTSAALDSPGEGGTSTEHSLLERSDRGTVMLTSSNPINRTPKIVAAVAYVLMSLYLLGVALYLTGIAGFGLVQMGTGVLKRLVQRSMLGWYAVITEYPGLTIMVTQAVPFSSDYSPAFDMLMTTAGESDPGLGLWAYGTSVAIMGNLTTQPSYLVIWNCYPPNAS